MPKNRNSESEITGSTCTLSSRWIGPHLRKGVSRRRTKRRLGAHLVFILGAAAACGGPPASGIEIAEIIDLTGDGIHSLSGPNALAIDAAGNVYVAGADSDNAFKVTPAGTITQIIDSAGDGNGHFLDFPAGIAVDTFGNVYVAGHGSDNAFKITPGGVITQIIGPSGNGAAPLNGSTAIAADEAGNVYVTGGISDNAFKVTPDGSIFAIIGSGGDGQGKTLDAPTSIGLDDDGNAFVVGSVSDNAFKITPGGTITEVIGPTQLDGPISIAVTSSGSFYVSDAVQNKVWKGGGYGFAIYNQFNGLGSGAGLWGAWGIFVDQNDDWYVTGTSSANAFAEQQLELINANGDGLGNTLVYPQAIVADGEGTVYVAGTGSHNVFKISLDRGACCLPYGECSEGTLFDCRYGGVYQGDDTTCGTAVCPQSTCGNAACEPNEECCWLDCWHDWCYPCDCPGYVSGLSNKGAAQSAPLPWSAEAAVSTSRWLCSCDPGCLERYDCCDNACSVCGVCSGCGNGYCEPVSEWCSNCPEDCGDCPTGACCLKKGCDEGATYKDCEYVIGGLYAGDDTTCTECPPCLETAIVEIINSSGDGAGNALHAPIAVEADGLGNLYIAATDSDNVFRISPAGSIQEVVDADGDGEGNTLDSPKDLAVDHKGNVYVVGGGKAFRLASDGEIDTVIDSTGDGKGNTLSGAWGIAVDDTFGSVYVAGANSNNVFKVTPGGIITEIIDSAGDRDGNTLERPIAITTDPNGNVYVVGGLTDNVFKITPSGVVSEIIDFDGDGTGNRLDAPMGIGADPMGNVYVIGHQSHNAFRITPAGVVTEIIDFRGDGHGNLLYHPRAIAVSATLDVYVTGGETKNAFRITPDGSIREIINSGGDGCVKDLDFPIAIAVDSLGNVYVADYSSDNAFKIALPLCGSCCGLAGAELLSLCIGGPEEAIQGNCTCWDLDGDNRVDLQDTAAFQNGFDHY